MFLMVCLLMSSSLFSMNTEKIEEEYNISQFAGQIVIYRTKNNDENPYDILDPKNKWNKYRKYGYVDSFETHWGTCDRLECGYALYKLTDAEKDEDIYPLTVSNIKNNMEIRLVLDQDLKKMEKFLKEKKIRFCFQDTEVMLDILSKQMSIKEKSGQIFLIKKNEKTGQFFLVKEPKK